ncbi:MAG TPA: hypothetical protein VGY56_16885 [Verrucomicrobiae bacterium]|nr:hypothetical protein [Verrucomicrobiae bacterium]
MPQDKGLDRICLMRVSCVVMKLIKLSLSESGYSTALTLAAAHGIPLESYIAGELEDLLDKKPQSANNQFTYSKTPDRPTGPQPSSRAIIPDTLQQVMDVCAFVFRAGSVPKDEVHARFEFRDAVRSVAKEWKIGETTVRDKCCTSRRLGLPDVLVNTDTFIIWLCKPELLRDHLCRKFPNCMSEIHMRFAGFLPSKFGTN